MDDGLHATELLNVISALNIRFNSETLESVTDFINLKGLHKNNIKCKCYSQLKNKTFILIITNKREVTNSFAEKNAAST